MGIDVLIVFALIVLALVLFATEVIPIDITAILILILVTALKPWTHISVKESISGFSNPATITILAMLILVSGLKKTGLIQRAAERLNGLRGQGRVKQLSSIMGISGVLSGAINDTPVVAGLMPVVSDFAKKVKASPSKFLIPLSFGAMMGGLLTVIGTSSNILASSISARLLDHPLGMFEITRLGIIVFIVGIIYVVFLGRRLIPERIEPGEDLVEEFSLQDYLTQVAVAEDSPFVGLTVENSGLNVLQIDRGKERFVESIHQKTIRAGDALTVKGDWDDLKQIIEEEGLRIISKEVSEKKIEPERDTAKLFEVVIPHDSYLVGKILQDSTFRQRYDVDVLAFQREKETLRNSRLEQVKIQPGDTLLVHTSEKSLARLSQRRDFVVSQKPDQPSYKESKIPLALLIMAAVIGLPAFNIVPIVISALGGAVAMILGGIITSQEAYESVNWHVIFLLAGIIPLGLAFEQSGAAGVVGGWMVKVGDFFSPVMILWLFYILTAILSAVISKNAGVVLMLPVAIGVAQQINVNPFAFVLAVTFAAGASFLTPVSHQTNLLVYGPGGYKFTDFFRVGAPLQFLISIVAVGGIVLFWGL